VSFIKVETVIQSESEESIVVIAFYGDSSVVPPSE
tara:strand:+ start:392 stop:496 length:105 start_codon:yes stop_codon:yes gene_type:complete